MALALAGKLTYAQVAKLNREALLLDLRARDVIDELTKQTEEVKGRLARPILGENANGINR